MHHILYSDGEQTDGPTPHAFPVVIGIDWSDKKHDICLCSNQGDELEFSILSNQVEALERWIHSLHQRFNGQPIAIALGTEAWPIDLLLDEV